MLSAPQFNSKLEQFRRTTRQFIRSTLPDDIRELVARERMDLPREAQVRWHRILRDRGGWCCPSWPKSYGGPGWSDAEQYIFEHELSLNNAPRLMIYGVGMLGPTLFKYGTEQQKAHFLPKILNAETFWCQGFSEPDSGSDLASLQCRMTAQGDEYVVSGSKIWTSEAHLADWIFGLFRSSHGERKQQGISFLMIDLASPGVSVQPLKIFENTHEVNQVFFDQVRVPKQNVVGEVDHGWEIGKYLLSLERFGTAEVSRTKASMKRLTHLAFAKNPGPDRLIDNVDFAERYCRIERSLHALEMTERRMLVGDRASDAIDTSASMLKIRGTEIQSDVFRLTAEAHAHFAAINLPDDAPAYVIDNPNQADDAARNYFNYRKTPIYSGSNEIQRNIIAKAELGLA